MSYMRILFIAALFMIALPQAAKAEVTIAVVDVQKLLTESAASKNVQKQLEEQRKKFLDELAKQEQTLREKQKTLAEQRSTMEKEEFAKKAKAFEEELLETRRLAQTRKASLDKASVEAMNRLRSELVKVVETMANEKKYDLVISSQNVVVGEKALDISDEAMKRLNDQIKEIPVKVGK